MKLTWTRTKDGVYESSAAYRDHTDGKVKPVYTIKKYGPVWMLGLGDACCDWADEVSAITGKPVKSAISFRTLKQAKEVAEYSEAAYPMDGTRV